MFPFAGYKESMAPIIGIIVILGCVFGGYILAGGKMEIIIHALPIELTIIGGAAAGAMVIANKTVILKKMGKTFKIALSGSKIHEQEYKDLLCVLFMLCKLIRSKGFISLEAHIENPSESSIFSQYPSVLANTFALSLICDTLRTISMGMENSHQIEDLLNHALEKFHHERSAPAHSLQTVSEGLPAIGIVAAVLGVIKTMASINKPPEILGQMIGGALVGTFLGVFLSYCIVGPFAGKAQQVIDEEQHYYIIIRDVLVAHLNGAAPQVSMEVGRGAVPSYYQPTFAEMEELSGNLQV
jgi:chemotaxis protein MotA